MVEKILSIILCLILIFSIGAEALEIETVQPDQSVYEGKDKDGDVMYLNNLAWTYTDKFIVEILNTADISEIDTLFENISKPLEVDEIDNIKPDFDNSFIEDEVLKSKINLFKLFGGLSGFKVRFEPVAYYKIHRDVILIGGYCMYERTYDDPYAAYWNCVCKIEEMTREVVGLETRLRMVDKIKELDDYVKSDKSFKIFILKDGKINSMWERK